MSPLCLDGVCSVWYHIFVYRRRFTQIYETVDQYTVLDIGHILFTEGFSVSYMKQLNTPIYVDVMLLVLKLYE